MKLLQINYHSKSGLISVEKEININHFLSIEISKIIHDLNIENLVDHFEIHLGLASRNKYANEHVTVYLHTLENVDDFVTLIEKRIQNQSENLFLYPSMNGYKKLNIVSEKLNSLKYSIKCGDHVQIYNERVKGYSNRKIRNSYKNVLMFDISKSYFDF